MECRVRPTHRPSSLAAGSRTSADRLWLAHGRLWLSLPETEQVLTSARLLPAHARLWLALAEALQVLTVEVPSTPAS